MIACVRVFMCASNGKRITKVINLCCASVCACVGVGLCVCMCVWVHMCVCVCVVRACARFTSDAHVAASWLYNKEKHASMHVYESVTYYIIAASDLGRHCTVLLI